MSLDKRKIGLIHVAKSRLGMSDDDYRAMLRRVAGVESSCDLDDFGFGQVMAEFQRLGWRSDFAAQNIGHRAGMATPAQIAKLRSDWQAYTDGAGDDRSLGKWLARQFKVSDLRFLTVETARKAIGALTVMRARKAGGQRGAA